MKLAVLTQYYPPEIGAPQARLSNLARAFAARGHQVTVLTAMPNYPTGKIHEGYRGAWMREERDGAMVVRTFLYPTQRTDFAHRLTSYCSFALSSVLWGTFYLEPPDYLLVESPPLFLGVAGVWLSWLKRTRLIFNVSDLWPDSPVRLGLLQRGSFAFRVGAALEGFCYRHAWLVTGQARDIVADITARYPSCPTFHLSNGVDTSVFAPERATEAARAILHRDGECVAVYAGLHGLAQGLDVLVDAADALPGDSNLDLVLLGDGPEKVAITGRVRDRRVPHVRLLDPRPHGEIPAILAAADVVIVPLRRHLPGAVPSKLYEALASGRPVILMAEGEAAEIVRRNDAGIVVPPGNVTELVGALRMLALNAPLRRRFGANGRAAAVKYFDRSQIAAGFIDMLEQRLAAGGGAKPSGRMRAAVTSRPQP